MKAHYLDEEKAARKAFRDPQKDPKILIVTQKLLTGYDAPVAFAMYLDKPLKDHTLLQAIARVNRPFPTKDRGLIVDYIGIFKDMQRALSGNTQGVDKGLIDLETLKPHFANLMADAYILLDPINPKDVRIVGEQRAEYTVPGQEELPLLDRTSRIIQYFWDEERRSTFFKQFKELEATYEVLSPDPYLVDYIDAYALVADIYRTTYSYFDPKADQRRQQRELLAKTEELIREHTHAGPVAEPLPLYPINRNIADIIEQDQILEQVKVINLQRSLIIHIQEHSDDGPYLLSIGEEVERIIEQLHTRQISVQTAIDELTERANQVNDMDDAHAASDLDGFSFTLGITLRAAGTFTICPKPI